MLLSPYRYEIDLLNEVLNIDFGPGAKTITEVKVGVRKKYLLIGLFQTHGPGAGQVGRS